MADSIACELENLERMVDAALAQGDDLRSSPYRDMTKLPMTFEAVMNTVSKQLPQGLKTPPGLSTRQIIKELRHLSEYASKGKGERLDLWFVSTLLELYFTLEDFSIDMPDHTIENLQRRIEKIFLYIKTTQDNF